MKNPFPEPSRNRTPKNNKNMQNQIQRNLENRALVQTRCYLSRFHAFKKLQQKLSKNLLKVVPAPFKTKGNWSNNRPNKNILKTSPFYSKDDPKMEPTGLSWRGIFRQPRFTGSPLGTKHVQRRPKATKISEEVTSKLPKAINNFQNYAKITFYASFSIKQNWINTNNHHFFYPDTSFLTTPAFPNPNTTFLLSRLCFTYPNPHSQLLICFCNRHLIPNSACVLINHCIFNNSFRSKRIFTYPAEIRQTDLCEPPLLLGVGGWAQPLE